MNDRIILVVDDETDLLEMVKSIFTRAGFTQVLTASSGETALKMCKEQEPDMIILDVMMPGMDGFATLKELRKTSKIPLKWEPYPFGRNRRIGRNQCQLK